jgi:hypothetical protein
MRLNAIENGKTFKSGVSPDKTDRLSMITAPVDINELRRRGLQEIFNFYAR